jgi:hypothetical protein
MAEPNFELTVTFEVQGFYGDFGTTKRSWKTWTGDYPTRERAEQSKTYFDEGINPKTTEKSAPSASRLVRRITLVEVLS